MRKQKEDEMVVLVSVLRSRRDLAIVQHQHWYRIPEKYAPKREFWYLAFYQPAAFGRKGGCIRYYVRVRGRGTARRIDLLPREQRHPRAQELYVYLKLGAVKELPQPIYNRAPRRVSFKFTTLACLLRARTILELYGVARTEEIVRRALARVGIAAIPQYCVRLNRRKRYFLDLAIIARGKMIAIECDNFKAHSGARQREKDRMKDIVLRRRGWRVFRFTERDIVSDVAGCVMRVKQAK